MKNKANEGVLWKQHLANAKKNSKIRIKQILAATAKNFIIFNLGEFTAFPSLVIPALLGMSDDLNPDEIIRITAAQTSWLGTFNLIIIIIEQKKKLSTKTAEPICSDLCIRCPADW